MVYYIVYLQYYCNDVTYLLKLHNMLKTGTNAGYAPCNMRITHRTQGYMRKVYNNSKFTIFVILTLARLS